MMRCLRRSAAVLGIGIIALSIFGLLAGHGDAFGKKKELPPQPVPAGGGTASGLSSVKITEDSRFRRVINVGRDCIKDNDYKQAVEALQAVLAEKDDYYVQVYDHDAFGKESPRWTSVKFEANNLIGSMPIEGLKQYELMFGGDAKTSLDEAKKTGDRTLLARVAQQFCHTKAGVEANEIEATLYLARGQVFTAALRFEKLMRMNPEWSNMSDVAIYKAAIAFHKAGDAKNKEIAWERLQKNLGGKGLKIGDQEIPMAKLNAVFAETAAVDVVNVSDWPSWRGNVRNTAQANGSPPLLDTKLWSRKIFRDKLDGLDEEDDDQDTETRVHKSMDQAVKANQPVLPGFFPIASQGIMVYRSQKDIRAVALKTILVKDEESGQVSEIKAGQIIWKSIPMNRSLWSLLKKNNTRIKVDQWFTSPQGGYDNVPGFSSFVYDNSLIGTLVTDHRYVYAINDLAVPPHPSSFVSQQFNPNFNQFQLGDIKPLVTQSELHAYDLQTGKLKWDLSAEDKDFKDSHFVSLPIYVGGKLYVLNEKLKAPDQPVMNPFGGWINPIGGDSELRLVVIDPNKLDTSNSNVKPAIVAIQALGDVTQYDRLVQDVGRRVNAVQLGYDEGILVCPTNAGEVFGIDLMTRSLVWSYPYRDNPHLQTFLPGMQMFPQPGGKVQSGTTIHSKWKSSPPAIAEGKIVFTAPDADSVHCISLRDGKPLWKRGQQKGDLYMAGVYSGRVVIVNENSVRLYDLKNGDVVKTISTGDMPSGQGVAAKGIYYLPLKKGEILAIDIAKGEIKAHNRAAGPEAAPGNLVFYETMVLSQTPTEVAAYPQLSARLDAAKIDAAKDPENIAKLTDYGELLLKDGQVHAAVDALVKAYNQKPAGPLGKRVSDRLFEALTDLMQIDFEKADKDYLTIHKALCTVPGNPAEEQNRKAKYFRLVGQGREAQGNLVEAFQMYQDFGALPMYRDQGGIPSPEDPNYKIPVNVWLRGRISGMLAKATPQQAGPLEAAIAAKWKEVDDKNDIDAIRSFVGMFDIPVRVGREARVRLAEAIMDRNERGNFLEAELLLHQLRGSEYRADPNTGGRALAALAHLEEKKGTNDSMRLAAAYYRELGRDYADKVVRGKKTGADLLSELATDKRYLPFLETASNPFGPVKLAGRDVPAGQLSVAGLTGFGLTAEGDDTPFARQNRLVFDLNDPRNPGQPMLRLRDMTTNTDRWSTNLGFVPMNQQLYFNLYQQQNNVNQANYPNARYRFYQVKGHLMVCQVGVMVYCMDGDTGKKLWEVQTSETIPQNGFHFLAQILHDAEGNPEFIFQNNQTQQRTHINLGRIAAAQASYVAVLGHKGLTVHDPLRGNIMWKKDGVSAHSHAFGDEQYLFLVEVNASNVFGAGRTIRSSDGEVQAQVPDFSSVYQSRIRTLGRQILAAKREQNNLTIHLYDILKGKDAWAKQFPAGSYLLHTEDRNITGVLEPGGKLTVLDAETGAEIVSSNLVQFRITPEDLKGLNNPILLQDSDRFYVALNKPTEGSKVQGLLQNNISSGARCLAVNGWIVAIQRNAGDKKVNGKSVPFQKGDLAWHTYMPVQNQMMVMDQFDNSPIFLFTTRYVEVFPNGGNRWVSVTQSYSKRTGAMLFESRPASFNGQPMFSTFHLDLKGRTVNLIGNGFVPSVQHYVDDGKAPPLGAMLNGKPQPGGYSNSIDDFPPELSIIVPAPGFRPRPPIGVVPPIIEKRPADK